VLPARRAVREGIRNSNINRGRAGGRAVHLGASERVLLVACVTSHQRGARWPRVLHVGVGHLVLDHVRGGRLGLVYA